MTNVHDILEKVRAARQRLPANEGAILFAAAVRLAAAQGATLRGRLVQIDDTGALSLAPFDDQAPETEPEYLAPELLAKDAPRKSEPRVQVYAAGALGYELLTGLPLPPPQKGPGPELAGPLGDIVRMALAADRRERFGDLTQLQDAVEGAQPRPPGQTERNMLSALRAKWARVPIEKEALAKLIEKLGQLEAQVSQLAKAQAKLEAGQRQALEQIDRFADGQQRLQEGARRQGSVVGPALLAGVLASASVFGVGWGMGMLSTPSPWRAAAVPQEAAPVPALAKPVPAPVPEPPAAVPEKPPPDSGAAVDKPASDAGVAAAAEPPDAGAPDASVVSAAADAGPPDKVAAAEAAPAPPKPDPRRRRSPEVSQAAMLHAVAISQVRRGEAALERGQADEALESFRTALENEPTLALAFRGMGMAYAMQGNDTQALQAYQKYLQLTPAAPDRRDIRQSIAELKKRAKIGSGEK